MENKNRKMPTWKTHEKWAERCLEWGENRSLDADLTKLIEYPVENDFLLSPHDFNRRTWRNTENRAMIYNTFGRVGLQVMDLHYCLDFLKEEMNPEIIRQKYQMMHPTDSGEIDMQFYPSTQNLARYLAGKTKRLDIDRKVFKFIIVNFREVLFDVVSEYEYDPEGLRGWDSFSFNSILNELEILE